jgi:integrase/ACT domain-containing protein
MAKILQVYWEEHARNIPSADSARRELDIWNEFWGDMTVEDVTRANQDRFRKFIGEGRLKPSTIDRILTTGRAALNWAVNHEMLESAPKIWLVETEEERRDRPRKGRPIEPEEAARLFDAIDEPHIMNYFMLAMCTLGRPGALLDVRREQYDHVAGTLNLNPPNRKQTKKYRANVLVAPSLKPWLESVTDPKALYVTRTGSRIRDLNHEIKPILDKAGLPSDITGYCFRHGLSQWLRDSNVPENQIDHYLGHLPQGGAKMTRIYARFGPKHCQEACQAIERYVTEVRSRLKVANLDDPAVVTAIAKAKARCNNGTLTDSRRDAIRAAIRDGIGHNEALRVFGISSPTFYKYRNEVLGKPTPAESRRNSGFLTEEQREALRMSIQNGVGRDEACRNFGISAPTFYKYRDEVRGKPVAADACQMRATQEIEP